MSRNETTPDQESTETSTAVAEPPAAETNSDGPSFAERVGQRKWTPAPDPFGIATDYQAGVSLFESKRDRRMAIKFGEGRPEDKPSQAVIDKMKEAGYRWNPSAENMGAPGQVRIGDGHPDRSRTALSGSVQHDPAGERHRSRPGTLPLAGNLFTVACPMTVPPTYQSSGPWPPGPDDVAGIAAMTAWR